MIEPFAIGVVGLPDGGRIGISRLPGRAADLSGDLDIVRRFGARVVLSMTPASEMASKGAAALPVEAARRGMAWRHFPIVDYGAPTDEGRWRLLADELHAVLDAGSALLLHCAGGRGRSGMAAARLLVERGAGAAEALAAVRAARPGAVETAAQEAWAAAGRAR